MNEHLKYACIIGTAIIFGFVAGLADDGNITIEAGQQAVNVAGTVEVDEVDHVDYAHGVCMVFEMARAHECKVIGANKEVRVWMHTTPWDAKSMCSTVRKDARKAKAMKGWEVYIFPPEGGQSLAGCKV